MHLKYLSYVIKKVIREQGDMGWKKGGRSVTGGRKKKWCGKSE